MKALIVHRNAYHYEIIPSIIELFPVLFMIKNPQFYVYDKTNDESLKDFITTKYGIEYVPSEQGDYSIKVYNTLVETDLLRLNPKHYYIAHDVKDTYSQFENVIYLCPFSPKNKWFLPSILPFSESKKQSDTPIVCVQGNIRSKRRDFDILTRLLETYKDLNFKIKIIGKGNLSDLLKKHSHKIILRNNLDFQRYHKEFLDCSAIFPLVDPIDFPQYFTTKLTSSISYGVGYNLTFFCHQKLIDIYNLKNAVGYTSGEDMIAKFPDFLKNLRQS